MRFFDKKPTAEEIKLKELEKKKESRRRALRTKTINDCRSMGLEAVKHRLNILKTMHTLLPEPILSKDDNIDVIEEAIEYYFKNLKNEKNTSSGQQSIG